MTILAGYISNLRFRGKHSETQFKTGIVIFSVVDQLVRSAANGSG